MRDSDFTPLLPRFWGQFLLFAFLFVASPGAFGQVVIIDEFENDLAPVTAVNATGVFPVNETGIVAGGLGGEMNFTLQLQDAQNIGEKASVNINDGVFQFNLDSGGMGRVFMHWDGTDGSPDTIRANTGLNGVDLTKGGTQDGVEIFINNNLADIDVALAFFSSSTDFSEMTRTIPAGSTPFRVKYDFSDLVVTGGNGADLTRCNAILTLIGANGGASGPVDLQIDAFITTQLDTSPPPGVLHDQLAPVAATEIHSLNFPGNNIFDAQAADDFTVPQDHFYTLVGYEVVGRFIGPQPSSPTANVLIYDNANGLPGQVVCQSEGVSLNNTGPDLWRVTTLPCGLSSGSYWFSLEANVDVGTEFTIRENSQAFGNPYLWQNPGNGFGTGCTDWQSSSSCGGTEPSLAFAIHGTSQPDSPIVFIVTNTNADGEGSLSNALSEAEQLNIVEAITIKFNIPQTDPGFDAMTGRYTIKGSESVFGGVLGGGTVIIDATTQPGYQGKPVIVLDGEGEKDTGILLGNASIDGTVRGLIFINYKSYGLHLIGSGNLIENCYFGTDGMNTGQGNGNGICFDVSGRNTLQDCIIGGNQKAGVLMDDGVSEFGRSNRIRRCAIGTDFSGMLNLGNGEEGIRIISGSDHVIGGAAGDGNVVRFNGMAGVLIEQGMNNKIEVPGSGQNIITQNGGAGVEVKPGVSGTQVEPNSINANAGLGIDLGGDGVTSNDPSDADTGANGLQNYPEIQSATISNGNLQIAASLNSTPLMDFRIDLLASAECDPSGFGEGENFLAADTVTTDAAGNTLFNLTVQYSDTSGQFITATATDPAGNTSEFGECFDLSNTTHIARNEQAIIPVEFMLEQNFPNPFNPTTQIGFQVPKSSRVTIRIYDLLGREVGELVDSEMEPGLHKIEFDAGGLASGIYIYRMEAGQFTQTRKLMFLK